MRLDGVQDKKWPPKERGCKGLEDSGTHGPERRAVVPTLVLSWALSRMPPARVRHGALGSGSTSRRHSLTLASAAAPPDAPSHAQTSPLPSAFLGRGWAQTTHPVPTEGLERASHPRGHKAQGEKAAGGPAVPRSSHVLRTRGLWHQVQPEMAGHNGTVLSLGLPGDPSPRPGSAVPPWSS